MRSEFTDARVESWMQAAMLLAKQNILNGSKAVKRKDFFVRELSFSINDIASLALWLSQGGTVSQLPHPAYLCSCQGSRLSLNSCLDKISGHRWFQGYVFHATGKYGFVPLTVSCECSNNQYTLVCKADTWCEWVQEKNSPCTESSSHRQRL